jgi:hypothetical protein
LHFVSNGNSGAFRSVVNGENSRHFIFFKLDKLSCYFLLNSKINSISAFKYLGVPQAAGFALQSFLWQKKPQKRISTSIPNAKCCRN